MKFTEIFRMIDKKFVYVLLFDLLFYAGLAVSLVIFGKLLAWAMGSFFELPGKMLALSKLTDFSQADAVLEGTGTLLNQFKVKIALGVIVFWLLFTINFVVFKGIAWSFITGRKIDKKYFMQLFRLNLLWFAVLFILLFLLFTIAKPGAASFPILFLLLIALYLTPLLYALFDPKKTIRELLKRLWHAAVERFYYFIMPWSAACAILVALVMLFSMVMLKFSFSIYVLLAVFVLWQAWLKYYLYAVLRGIR